MNGISHSEHGMTTRSLIAAWRRRTDAMALRRVRLSIAAKLILSFLLAIAVAVIVFILVGTQLVGRLILVEAQAGVTNALNAAREILSHRLDNIDDVVRLTADRFFLKNAMLGGRIEETAAELVRTARNEGLDFLTVTDASGRVVLRTTNPGVVGDSRNHDPLMTATRARKVPVASVSVMPAGDLRRESPFLADRAYVRLIDTPRARPSESTELTSGMVLQAVAPILDFNGGLIGLLYGGVLLNRNYEIVDKVKETVFQGFRYGGRDAGTSTLFLGDVRIATNVLTADGSRAVGTRVAADVYGRVVGEGRPWVGRAFVVNDWYITAYEPIRTLTGEIIGILYVGVLEHKYVDIRRRTVGAFLALALAGGLVAMALSYQISRRASAGIQRLATAARTMAHGDLDVRVAVKTHDELEELADAFNVMAASLQTRDEQLREVTRSRIRESERLATIGQLAAGVAHELNNPLQGILAYSHLLLERTPSDSPLRPSLQKVANQANRCREIIQGLLDFARPRTPQAKPTNLNATLQECVALVRGQAMFHNIRIIERGHDDLPAVIVDPSQLQQVFMNMIINAAEAMDGVGTLTLTTRFDPQRRTVEVEVTDTGHGIPPEDLPRIFDPFFTTKAPGHGVGLGLAISQQIVREHRGTITVRNEAGRGTTFVVTLPIQTQGEAQES